MELIDQKRLKGLSSMSEQAEDRFTNLPDSLLHYVLSLLDIKEVARTSVLSKRWYYIWISIPTLDFRSLNGPAACWKSSIVTYRDSSKFMDIVDRILHLHDMSSLQKLSLHWSYPLNKSRVSIWISAAVRRNVEELSLTLFLNSAFFTPLSLCTCESLVTLELDIFPNHYLPNYISFPKLKHFNLSRVKFSDMYNNESLFSSCPVLENLTMEDCEWFNVKNFCLSIPSLKVLKICGSSRVQYGYPNCAFEIYAPSLESLIYRGGVPKEIVMSNILALVEVDLDFGFNEYDTSTEGRRRHSASLSKFLRALSHVKCLTISDLNIQVLSPSHNLRNSLPTFHNLEKLNITHDATTYKPLIALLQSAPNLESVSFSELRPGDDFGWPGNDFGIERYDSGDAWARDFIMFPKLKSVCFGKFYGHFREVLWVELILRQAAALETLTFFFPEAIADEEENLMENLLSLPSASASCEFIFC